MMKTDNAVVENDLKRLLKECGMQEDFHFTMYKYNKKLISNAQALRKNMTDEEKHLWYDFLKELPVTVNRQKNIDNYIIDFFISSKGIAIEIDGRQHKIEENAEADRKRDAFLNSLGITVLRYSNEDINERFNIICYDILNKLGLSESDLKR